MVFIVAEEEEEEKGEVRRGERRDQWRNWIS